MAASKKILTVFPEDLLQTLDGVSNQTGITRSELIRRAVSHFLKLQRELQMINGYEEMGEINLKMAESGLLLDNEQLMKYEKLLLN